MEDHNEMMKEALEKIQKDFEDSDSVYTALEVVDKCCDNLDVPRNLHKFGGVEIMLKVLEHPNSDIACKGAALFTLMLSNNPVVQKVTGEKNALDAIYKFSDRGEEPFFRALGLASALIRHESDLEDKFVAGAGSGLIVKALSPDQSVRIRTKGGSLLRHLLLENKIKAGDANILKIAEGLTAILPLDIDHISYGEVVASISSSLYQIMPTGEVMDKFKNAASDRQAQLKQQNDDRSAEIDM